jgi:NADH-quinone oxidoreductase subunit E
MTPTSATQLVDDLRTGVEVCSTRGPRICTWREAERVLAGFPDDRADEGPSAGPASLVGVELARANGWTAPSTEPERGHDGHHAASRADGSGGGRPATSSSTTGAAEQADTSRAESESKADESAVDTKGGPSGGTDGGSSGDSNGDTKAGSKGEK